MLRPYTHIPGSHPISPSDKNFLSSREPWEPHNQLGNCTKNFYLIPPIPSTTGFGCLLRVVIRPPNCVQMVINTGVHRLRTFIRIHYPNISANSILTGFHCSSLRILPYHPGIFPPDGSCAMPFGSPQGGDRFFFRSPVLVVFGSAGFVGF